MIYIHKGDDTDFNDNSFLTFNIVTEKDLTGWQAKFILNGLEKTFEDITSKSFELHYSDEETCQFKLGKTTNELKLIDEEGKIKTVAKNIEISVTNEVIENESQLINLPILKDEGIDINISLASNSGGGGTANHFELLYRDMANQHPIKAITNLQETLDAKANKNEIPNLDEYVTNTELENKGYLTEHQDISNLATKEELQAKQNTLISGTNIKTINNQSILGKGNITIAGSGQTVISSNYDLFDIKTTDYILEGEKAEGWALQNTYVIKEFYPDFYNKCLEEYKNETNTLLNTKINITGTLNHVDGVLSGFSLNDYAQANKNFESTSTPWEIVIALTTGSIVTGTDYAQVFYTGGYNKTNRSISIRIDKNGFFDFSIGSGGEDWIITDLAGTYVVQPNTDYLVKLSYSGTDYVLAYSTDEGKTYIEDIKVQNKPVVIGSYTPYFGTYVGSSNPYNYFGSIDFKKTYINVNGERYWTGANMITKHPNGHKYYPISQLSEIEDVYAYGIDEENETVLLPKSKNVQDYEYKYYRVI